MNAEVVDMNRKIMEQKLLTISKEMIELIEQIELAGNILCESSLKFKNIHLLIEDMYLTLYE